MAKPVFSVGQIVSQLDSGYRWSDAVVGYAFAFTVPAGGFAGGESEGLTQFSGDQRVAARLAVGLWDDLVVLDLYESVQASANFLFVNSSEAGQAYAYYPPVGDVFVNAEESSNLELDFGDYGYYTLLHEVGHSLGLNHPGDYSADESSLNYVSQAEYQQDSQQYTVMSYWEADNTGASYGVNAEGFYNRPSTPMLHDIAAIQAIYGADTSTRVGDTVYGFNSNTHRSVFDFSSAQYAQAPVLTIWDAGGNDTLDLSGYSAAARVDLSEGTYSDVGGLTDNIAIAFGAEIENAIGGNGSDVLVGQGLANRLEGGAGHDTLVGGAGDDVLLGGSGTDTAQFNGELADYRLLALSAEDYRLVGLDGADQLSGVESLVFEGGGEGGGGADEVSYTLGQAQASIGVALEVSAAGVSSLAVGGNYAADWVIYDEASADFTLGGVANDGRFDGLDRLVFDDGVLAIDRADVAFEVHRLYAAAFAREPDVSGLSYWVAEADVGASIDAIAKGFYDSAEFVETYGSGLTHEQLIDVFYRNVLGRDSDADGAAYWLAELQTGGSEHGMLVSFSNSAENIAQTELVLSDGVWFV